MEKHFGLFDEPSVVQPTVVEPQTSTALVLQATAALKPVVRRESLSAEALTEAHDIARTVDFRNGTMILMYSADVQNTYKEQALELLQGVKAGDLGMSGDLAASLHAGIDILDIERMQQEVTPDSKVQKQIARWSQMPVFGERLHNWLSSIYQFALRQEEFVNHIRKAEALAKDDMVTINEYVMRMQRHRDAIEQTFRSLEIRIVAGEIALERGKSEYEEMAFNAKKSMNALDLANAQRFAEEVTAFDDRVFLLKTRYVRAPISIQRVEQQQHAGRQEIRNIIGGLLTDLVDVVEAAVEVAGLASMDRAQQRRLAMESVSDRISTLRDDIQDRTHQTALQGRNQALARVQRLETHLKKVVTRMERSAELRRETDAKKREADAMLLEIQEIFSDAQVEHMLPEKIGA